jgi:hypothetical protein
MDVTGSLTSLFECVAVDLAGIAVLARAALIALLRPAVIARQADSACGFGLPA